jgi:hypothetical protein
MLYLWLGYLYPGNNIPCVTIPFTTWRADFGLNPRILMSLRTLLPGPASLHISGSLESIPYALFGRYEKTKPLDFNGLRTLLHYRGGVEYPRKP